MNGARIILAPLLLLYLGLSSASVILPSRNDVLAQQPDLPLDLFELYPEPDTEQDSESSPMNCDENGNFIGMCTFDLVPRCGSDGVTYMGECEVAKAQCKNPHLFITVSGPCHDYEVCELPAESGICMAYMPRFYFNSESGKCEEFIYGGCQGNDNNFKTIQECIENCDKPMKCTGFQCDNGQCIDSSWECDGDYDCALGDGSDESNCFPQCEEGSSWREDCNSCLCSNGQAVCTEKFCTPEPVIVAATPEPCSMGQWTCRNGQCIDSSQECGDKSGACDDEGNCIQFAVPIKPATSMSAPALAARHEHVQRIPVQHNYCKYRVGDEMIIGKYNEECKKCENCHKKCQTGEFDVGLCKCKTTPICK